MKLRALLAAGAALALCAGGIGLAQEEMTERTAPPPPADAPPPDEAQPPPPAAETPLANAVTPDEAAPPPEEPEPPKPVAKAAANEEEDNEQENAMEAPPPPPPLKRPRYAVAILQAVEKSSAETLRFEAKVGQPIRYKGLVMTVHACETNAADDDQPDSMAHIEMLSQPQVVAGRAAQPPRQVFRGWMFASSPSLHPLEHPLYDVWLIACKTEAPLAPGASL